MKTTLAIAAIAALSFTTFGAHAAEKQMQIESWSFGCSNPAMASSTGTQASPGYDLKKGTKISERTTQTCPSDDVKAPRDVATGQSSGKRTHQPVR